MNGYLVRFQTFARENTYASKKIFYCYSKVITYSNGKVFNNETFCSQSPNKTNPALDFPYNTSSDPYSNSSRNTGTSADDAEDDFSQPGSRGFEDNLDPFYNSYSSGNSEGPDARDGWLFSF